MTKKNQTLLIILGVLGLGGLILLLKKPAVAAVPVAPAGVPAVPTSAYPAYPVGCEGQMIQMAEQQLGLPRSELTVRSLRPNDLGLGSIWSMNLANINAWNTTISANIGSDRFVCLKSVSYSGTAAEAIRVTAGGSVVAEINIEHIPGLTQTHTASIPDIIVEQNQNITVQVYASAVSATDNLILSGVVVERRGRLLA